MSKLRTWRREAGLTIEAVAAKLRVSVGSLSRIERGEQWPDRQFFERMASLTNGDVTANDFLPAASASKARGDSKSQSKSSTMVKKAA